MYSEDLKDTDTPMADVLAKMARTDSSVDDGEPARVVATPGPWFVEFNPAKPGQTYVREGRSAAGHIAIAHLTLTLREHQVEANAYLIAAAPQLRYAIQRLLACPSMNLDTLDARDTEAIAIAREALLNAEVPV